MTRAISLLCALFMLSACTGDESTTSTASTAPPPSTTTTQSPPTTASTTSTSTSTTSTVTTEAVEAPPRWLQDELPDFDLTVEDPTGITDFERLIDEYFIWRSWLAAHPMPSADELESALRAMLCVESPNFPDGSPFNQQLLDDSERWEIPISERALTAFHPGYTVEPDDVWLIYRERVSEPIIIRDLNSGSILRTLNTSGGSWTSVDQRWRRLDDGTWCVWDTKTPDA